MLQKLLEVIAQLFSKRRPSPPPAPGPSPQPLPPSATRIVPPAPLAPPTSPVVPEPVRDALLSPPAEPPRPSLIWPLRESFMRISQPFGVVWSANSKKMHTGIDIAVAAGEKVFAIADGVIVKIGSLGEDWAQYADLQHDSKDYCSAYLHIVPSAAVGTKLKAGEVIGSIADLGSNSHLHFNIWEGVYHNLITHRGALPSNENAGKVPPEGDPAFPSNFVDPMSFYG